MKQKTIFRLALFAVLAGIAAAAYSYIGPNRTVTTTTWERQYCNYRATITSPAGSCYLTLYFSPGSCPSTSSVAGYFGPGPLACGSSWPGTCGAGLSCNISLLTGSTQSCSSGETGCTQTTNTTTYPPATVSGTTACTVPGNNGWCRGTATLNLSGNEPLAPAYSLTIFEGSPGTLCSAPSCAWNFPEGSTSLNYWVHTTFGDTSTMASASMMVDSVAPAPTLTIPPADGLNGWFVSGPVTASASATDATSGVNSVNINAGSSTFTASADGTYALNVTTTDNAGNSASTSGTIRLDTTPPSLSVSVPPANGLNSWYNSPVALTGSGSDATSGLATIRYRVDGGAWTSGTSLNTPGGAHVIEFQASDVAGNSATVSNTTRLDTTPPSLSISIPPANGLNGWFVSGPVTASASATDATSGVSGLPSINGGGASFAASTNGIYNLTATVSDVAGNTASTSGTIRLDTTPPNLSVSLASPDGLNNWYISPAALTGTASDATSGVAGVQYQVDGGSWQNGSSISAGADGTHTIVFRTSNNAGITTTAAPVTILVDRTAPIPDASLASPDGANGWYVSPVTVTANSSDATSGLSSQGVSLDGTTWTPSLTVSSGGLFVVQVRAVDKAGNIATTTRNIRLDPTAPTASFTAPAPDGTNNWYVSSPVVIGVTGTDGTSGIGSELVSLNGITWSSSLTLSTDGVYPVRGRVTDNAGNVTNISGTVRLDTTPPSLSVSVPPADGSNGWYISPVALTCSGSDATSGLATMRYRVDGGAWVNGAKITVSDGVHVVEFQASDVAGNLTSESHTISVDTTPPTVTVTLPAPQGAAGWYTSGLQFSATGNDANSGVQSVAYSLDGGATWQAGPLSLVEDQYTIITRVTDRAGNFTTSTNTVDVDTTPPQSAFTTPAEGTTTVIHGSFTMNGQTLDLTSGPAAAEISVDGGTTWQPLAIAGGTWSYTWDTNAVPNGTYTILVRASDVAGNEEHTAQITVVIANKGPEVSLTKTWWLWEQAEVSIQGSILPVTGAQITISDGQGHTRTYNFNAGNLPSSLKWDGTWSGGLVAPPGDFAVVVTAWDAFGNTGQDSGTVRIPAPLATPTREPPAIPASTTEAPPPATVAGVPTVVPQVAAPAPGPGPSKPQMVPKPPPAIDPVYIWPAVGLVGLLAALASSSLSDKRPSALRRLGKVLTTAASGPEETKK